MKFNKYNIGKGNGNSTTVSYSGGGSSSSSSSTSSRGDSGLDRMLWGNSDDGSDIDDTMFVNGSVYLKKADYSDEDDEDDDKEAADKEYTFEDDDEGGNIYADGKVKSNEVEANDIYAKQHLYIPHPTTKAKTDIVELLKGYDTRITNNSTNIAANKTEIDALKGRVITAETNITNLTSKVNNNTTAITNNTTNIQANADEIEKLKNQVSNISGDIESIDLSEITNTLKSMQDELKVLRYGNYQHPVVLLSGKIHKYSYSSASNLFNFSGCKSELITNLAISADGGTLTVTPTFADNTSIYINAIHVTQEMSGDTANNDTATKSTHSSSTSLSGRSDGAHWFEAYYEDKKFKIRELHQANGDNDSWTNNNWAGDGGGIRAINITVIGYLFQMN